MPEQRIGLSYRERAARHRLIHPAGQAGTQGLRGRHAASGIYGRSGDYAWSIISTGWPKTMSMQNSSQRRWRKGLCQQHHARGNKYRHPGTGEFLQF